MLFSILVPVYKVEKYLEECLESVLRQTYGTYELILVDDGSPDRCGQICDEYQARDPEKTVVIHQKNAGLLAARRAAIARASGDFCVFLDSDDTLEPNCLQTVHDLVRANGADIVLYNKNTITAEGAVVASRPVFRDGRIFSEEKEEIYREFIGSHALNNIFIKAIRTGLLKDDPTDYTGYFSNSQGEDLLQSLYPVTHARSIVYCAAPLYNYRENPASITRSYDRETIGRAFNRQVDRQLLRYMKIWKLDRPEDYELFYAKRAGDIVNFVRFYFKYCGTERERRAFLDIDWSALLLPELLAYRNDRRLSAPKRLLLLLIRKKQYRLLRLLLTFGNR